MIRAHKVIEDLQEWRWNYIAKRPKNVSEEGANHVIDTLIRLIKRSIKFQFGQFDDLTGMFSEKALSDMVGGRIFRDNTEDLIFPFEGCWFEYDTRILPLAQHAVLVSYDHKKRNFAASFFGRSKAATNNIWLLEPISVDIGIGHDLDGSKSNIAIMQVWTDGVELNDIKAERVDGIINLPICFLVLALKLLNCNNIGTVEKYPPKNLQKKRARKNKPPLFKYKTLIIKPVGKRQEALAAQGLWTQAISYSKGHFKYYPPPGLFGKYPGRFWWQPQVRGNKKRGIIVKNYKIPETESPKKKAKK